MYQIVCAFYDQKSRLINTLEYTSDEYIFTVAHRTNVMHRLASNKDLSVMFSYIYDLMTRDCDIFSACIFVYPMRYVRFENETICKHCAYSIIMKLNPEIAINLLSKKFNDIILEYKSKKLIE